MKSVEKRIAAIRAMHRATCVALRKINYEHCSARSLDRALAKERVAAANLYKLMAGVAPTDEQIDLMTNTPRYRGDQ